MFISFSFTPRSFILRGMVTFRFGKKMGIGWSLFFAAFWVLTVLISPVKAADGYSFLNVRAEGVYAGNSVGNSSSAVVSWLPYYEIVSGLSVKGNIGFSAYAGADDSTFGVINSGVLFSYDVMSMLSVELGGGAQTWLDDSSYGMGNLNLAWKPESPILGRINKVVAGYSSVATEEPTHEFRVGIEIDLAALVSGVGSGVLNPE